MIRNASVVAPDTRDLLTFSELRIGDSFRSRSHRMTLADIRAFATAYDPQVFHVDPERAAQTLFGRLVASGWHTAAVTMRLFVEAVPIAGGLIGAGVGEIRWPRPVLPDDELHVVVTVETLRESRSRPDIGLAGVRVETRNQNDEIVQIMRPQLVVPRQDDAVDAGSALGKETS